ncbi:hypothetical protein PYW08_014685 [Mythimna loreyi]|uniref:Uncharacterized protein n=1 Tax=Mythimna loreyi TaxID=667449 RepID=A0ACC2R5A8_9NEOP|nr:hypothetical protein PYW08_014685 [Mythimna loreyi]
MFNKKLYFTLIALLVISNVVCGKKIKKNKRPKDQEDTTTIQPNVVAYSTFGFNDVGAYDGFIPTSPDYATFLSGNNQNQEATTRLYAPAFPSSLDSSGFGGNYGPQTFDGQSFGGNEDNMGQPGMLQYSSSSMNIFNTPNFGTTGEQNKNIDSEDTNTQHTEDSDAPVYGTKINSRNKYRTINPFNNTEFNVFNNGYTNLADEKYLNFPSVESTHENKPTFSEFSGNYQNSNNNAQNYEQSENEEFGKPASSSVHNNVVKFQRVVDFTNIKPYHQIELDTSKFFSPNNQPLSPQNSIKNTEMENGFSNNFDYNSNDNKFMDSSVKFADHYNMKNNEESSDKSVTKSNSYFNQDTTYNHLNTRHKNNVPNIKTSDQKKKIKHKPWSSGNYSNDFTDWKDSSIKGYGYSTNYSNMHFRYGVSEPKKPFNNDEIVPASSNVDLTNYQYPETDYSNIKKLPEFSEDDDFNSVSFKDKIRASDYLNQFKNSFSTVPTTTSYWGSSFKSSDFSSIRDHPKKTHYSDINTDTVVNIPKRPHKLSYSKATENKLSDWPQTHHSRPHKVNKPINDWTKDLFDTRYKSEEDLLGLRTHDTSHPTYLPTFKPSNNVFDNDNEFKNLVEKWRQSYLKTKYKDVPVRDYESYGSEIKSQHVPIPKPYPVTVPVEKPYPVHIPYVRPLFHHTKPVHEDPEDMVEDDYMRRPEIKKPSQYKKRPYGTRNRSRRPSRQSYQERTRRRWPERRRPSPHNTEYRHQPRPSEYHAPPYKHREYEHEEEDEHSDYALYCRRTGNC